MRNIWTSPFNFDYELSNYIKNMSKKIRIIKYELLTSHITWWLYRIIYTIFINLFFFLLSISRLWIIREVLWWSSDQQISTSPFSFNFFFPAIYLHHSKFHSSHLHLWLFYLTLQSGFLSVDDDLYRICYIIFDIFL